MGTRSPSDVHDCRVLVPRFIIPLLCRHKTQHLCRHKALLLCRSDRAPPAALGKEEDIDDDEDPYDPEEGPELLEKAEDAHQNLPDAMDDDDDDEFHHRDDDDDKGKLRVCQGLHQLASIK